VVTTPLGEIIASRRAPVATKSWTVRASVDDTSAMSGRCSPSSHVAAPGVPSSSGVKRSSQRTSVCAHSSTVYGAATNAGDVHHHGERRDLVAVLAERASELLDVLARLVTDEHRADGVEACAVHLLLVAQDHRLADRAERVRREARHQLAVQAMNVEQPSVEALDGGDAETGFTGVPRVVISFFAPRRACHVPPTSSPGRLCQRWADASSVRSRSCSAGPFWASVRTTVVVV